MLKAASRLKQVDLKLARETYLDALTAALLAGRLAVDPSAQVVARAARAAPRSDEPVRASGLLLEGLVLLITDGYKSGTSLLKRAMSAFRADDVGVEERLRWSWLAGGAAGLIWDHETWDVLTAREEQLARDVGALTVLPITLSSRAGLYLFAGDVAEAAFLVDQVQVVTDASDNQRLPNAALAVAAFRGEEHEARRLIEATAKDSLARGEGLALAVALWATAVLCNGLGQYEEAFRAAIEALKDPNDLGIQGGRGSSWLKRPAVRAKPSRQNLPWSIWRKAPTRAGRTGLLLFKQGVALCSLTPRKQKLCTERPSSGFCRRGCDSTLPVPDCSTESGCGDSAGGETLGTSYAAPTTFSGSSVCRGSRAARQQNCLPLEKGFASVRSTLAVT
jgi:tetratricopeptide (TPR) repeat protein